jgi:Ion channel
MFAAFYAAIERLGGGSFFAHQQPANTQTFQYFSFTTLTTLGYGDFTAAGNGGRALAVIEAPTGQVFLATLVARLVAAFRSPQEQARAGAAAADVRQAGRRLRPGYPAHGSRLSYHRKPAAGRRPQPSPPASPGSPGPSGSSRPSRPSRPSGSPDPPEQPEPPGAPSASDP